MTDIEDDEDEGEYAQIPEPLILGPEGVAIMDADYLCRQSGVEGVIAVRVTADLEVEYLDGASRVWLNAAIPPGPRRN